MPKYQLATIGAGNMAEAVLRAVLRSDLIGAAEVIAMDPDPKRREMFAEQFGIAVTESAAEAASYSSTVLLATKPQIFPDAAAAMADQVRADHLLISIMAGVPIARIDAAFAGTSPRVVRVMPNLPMVVGAGMAGVFAGPKATVADLTFVRRIFDAAGRSVVIDDESLMDAVTAVSGSGPAYYYLFTEAIVAGAIRAGLPEHMARTLAMQACLGAGRMMAETGEPPEQLRQRVTSKAGTTAAALDSLRHDRVREHIADAVIAAFVRGRDLGS